MRCWRPSGDNIIAATELARSVSLDDFLAIVETLAASGYLDTQGYPLPLLQLLDAAIADPQTQLEPLRLHHLLSKRGNASFNRGEYPETRSAGTSRRSCSRRRRSGACSCSA